MPRAISESEIRSAGLPVWMHELRTLSSELPVKEQERARNLSHMLRSELTSLRQGPSSLAQRLKKATPGTYSKNSQKHFGSVVLDQPRRSANLLTLLANDNGTQCF